MSKFWRAVDNMAEGPLEKRPKLDEVQIDHRRIWYLDRYPGQTWLDLEESLR